MMKFEVALLLWTWLTWTHICDCAPLQTDVTRTDGSSRDGSTSCVGENVTFTCTISTVVQQWDITSLGFRELVSIASPTFSDPGSPFTIEGIVVDGMIVNSTLTVTSTADLNGRDIVCSDSASVGAEVQETTAMVFGPPSAPGLTVTRGADLASYDFIISASMRGDCVVISDYIITATSSAGSRDITVPAGDVDGSTPVNVGGFSVCTGMYNFTVIPVLTMGTGAMRSDSVPSPDAVSAPGLTVMPGEDLTSYLYFIGASSPSECVTNYTITPTSGDGTVLADILVQPGQLSGSTPNAFSVCTTNYSFMVTPNTRDGPGPAGMAAYQAPGPLTDLEGTSDSVSWSTSSETCFREYHVSLTNDPGTNLRVLVTRVTFAALINGSFPLCVTRSITVIPVLRTNDTLLINSSVLADIIIMDPGIGPVELRAPVTATELTVPIMWQTSGILENVAARILRSAPGGECTTTDIVTVPKRQGQYSLSLSCELPVMVCVQFVSGECETAFQNRTITVNAEQCATEAASAIGPIVGGICAAVAVLAVIIVGVLLLVYCLVCKGKKDSGKLSGSGSDGVDGRHKPTVPYHSAGPAAPQTSVEMEQHAPGAMYADPKAIEHESAAGTGEEYALISSNTKAKKKKNDQPEASANLGDMYSVPDKSKKKQNQNQGLVYADIDIANPQRPPPRSHGSRKQPQPEDESVTYAVVAAV